MSKRTQLLAESKSRPSTKVSSTRASLENWLLLARLRAEKCEYPESRLAYEMALKLAKRSRDIRGMMEALAGLLRLSSDDLDEKQVARLDKELRRLMEAHEDSIPPMAWYCKGVVARVQKNGMKAQRYFLRFLKAARADKTLRSEEQREEMVARALIMLAAALRQRDHYGRALVLTRMILKKYEAKNIKTINGMAYLVLGNLAELDQNFEEAMSWFQKSHTAFMAEHNWSNHLYVLYGYARLARKQGNFTQAYWYIDLVDQASQGEGFGVLQREVVAEKQRLEQDAVDLLIDSRKAMIKTRESGKIDLKKQYVLLHILEALSNAHRKPGDDLDRGLSKAEIIEQVWNERYRPEAHDNKLYYNINRLRRLIEPDLKKPQYLLNWKEGYRLAPGLRVHYIGGRASGPTDVKEGIE